MKKQKVWEKRIHTFEKFDQTPEPLIAQAFP